MKEFFSIILRYGLFFFFLCLGILIASFDDPEFNGLMELLGLFTWCWFFAKMLIPETLEKRPNKQLEDLVKLDLPPKTSEEKNTTS